MRSTHCCNATRSRLSFLFVCFCCFQALAQTPGPQSSQANRLAEIARLVSQNRTQPVENVVDLGNEALMLLKQNPDAETEIGIRLGMSWALSRKGDATGAEGHARAARKLALASEFDAVLGEAEYYLGVALFYQARLPEALEAGRRAREIQNRNQDLDALATTLTLLGAVHRSAGSYDLALESHLQALDVATALADADAIARSNNNVGLIYWNLDQHEKALSYLQPALDTYRDGDDTYKIATALSNLGLILIELGEPRRALVHLQEAVNLHQNIDNPRGRARILSNLGFAHEELGDLDTALDFTFQSLELRQDLGDRIGMARSYGSIASIFAKTGQPSEAEQYFKRALEQAEEAGAKSEQIAIHAGMAAVHETLGNYEAALAAHKSRAELAAEVHSAEAKQKIAEFEAANAVSVKERELEAIRQEQTQQQLALARQQTRLALMALIILLLLVVAAGLVLLTRKRSRSLATISASHEDLQKSTTRLKQSEQRYRSVFDDPVTPKLLLDLERRCLIEANAPAETLCANVSGDPLPGTSVAELKPRWLRDAINACSAHATSEVCQAEAWMDDHGNVHHSEIRTTPLALDNKSCAVVTVHDVTEEKRIEEERIKQDKLESLGLLAGGIAHDFNNAMVAVLGHVSLAQYQAGQNSEVQPLLREAESAIDHAVNLTSQLLTFAKGGEPRRELCNVAELVVASTRFALSGSSTSVDYEIEDGLWSARLDQTQFKQAVGNLVMNASQSMSGSGSVAVSAFNLMTDTALSPTVGAGPFVAITVHDSGPGIPIEIQDKVLDPYFSTKQTGSGLGLATAFAIVCRHEGWLDFQSDETSGTTFKLYFPADPGATPRTDDQSDECPEGTGRILVMDDDPAVQEVYRVALSKLGYDLQITSNGHEAIEAYQAGLQTGRRFDAVVMDLTVPGSMGGNEAMSALRSLDPAVLGIVASGYSNDPVMSGFRQAGFSGALRKPFSLTQLGIVLKQVLSHAA